MLLEELYEGIDACSCDGNGVKMPLGEQYASTAAHRSAVSS